MKSVAQSMSGGPSTFVFTGNNINTFRSIIQTGQVNQICSKCKFKVSIMDLFVLAR